MEYRQLLKESNYALTLFTDTEIKAFETSIIVKEFKGKPAEFVPCLVRGKELKLTPEEIVRQLYLRRLVKDYGYAKDRLAVEWPVQMGADKKKADIVILDKDHPTSAYIIIELKKPKLKEGKDQLKSYCHATGAPIGVWTNGGQISYYHRKDPNFFEDLTDLPKAKQTLADILN